jgi:hypothetical protein
MRQNIKEGRGDDLAALILSYLYDNVPHAGIGGTFKSALTAEQA